MPLQSGVCGWVYRLVGGIEEAKLVEKFGPTSRESHVPSDKTIAYPICPKTLGDTQAQFQ